MKKAVLYLRVSTNDGRQDTQNQLKQLRDACARWNYDIIEIYEDHESGGKGRRGRPEFDRMLSDAERKAFDVVVFWALDRFSREGFRKTFEYLQVLDNNGIAFRSLQEEYFNTDNSMVRDLLIVIMSYMAKMERERISARTKAGLARKRREDPEWAAREGAYCKKVLSKKNMRAADEFARSMIPTIEQLKREGHRTIMQITEAMNRRGIETASGSGRWHISTTHKLLDRIEALA